MPTLDVQITIKGQLRENVQHTQVVKQPISKDDWYEVHRDEVKRRSNAKNAEILI